MTALHYCTWNNRARYYSWQNALAMRFFRTGFSAHFTEREISLSSFTCDFIPAHIFATRCAPSPLMALPPNMLCLCRLDEVIPEIGVGDADQFFRPVSGSAASSFVYTFLPSLHQTFTVVLFRYTLVQRKGG